MALVDNSKGHGYLVLVDYSKGQGYSVLVENESRGKAVTKDHKDFDFALSMALGFAATISDYTGETIEPMISFPAIQAIRQEWTKEFVDYAPLLQLVEIEAS